MRKTLGWLLTVLGAFLLVVAVLGWTWIPSAAKRTPLNIDTYTDLTGQAQKLNPATGELENVPVVYQSHTTVDPDKSDDDVVAFVNTKCVNIDRDDPPPCLEGEDDRVITNSIDTFATDRQTALAVDDAKYLADGAVPHVGLVNKWPFDTEKKTYPYWDGTLGKAVDATYEGTKDYDGLETYEFSVVVPPTSAEILKDTQGTYETTQTLWVDPVTGSIIDQSGSQVLMLESGTTVLDIEVAYTDKTVQANVDDAKANGKLIGLMTGVLPWVALVLGLVLLVVGLMLARSRRPATEAGADA